MRGGRGQAVASCALLVALTAAVVLSAAAADTAKEQRPAAPSRAAAVQLHGTVAAAGTAAGPRSWAPTHMASSHTYTRQEAVALARRHDLIAALPGALRPYVAAMRAANPALVLLAYTNGMLATPAQAATLPPDWFATDAAGRRIRSTAFGNLLMDPRSAGWQEYSLQQCRDRVRTSGYDGCLVDMLTLGVFARGYLTALPVDRRTGQPVEVTRYRDELLALARRFAALDGVVVAGNTVTSARRYWSASGSSRPVALALESSLVEDFLRGGADAPDDFPDEAAWRREVEVLEDLHAQGTSALVTTKLWVPASAALRDQVQRYAMGSYLLGAGPDARFAFTAARTPAGASGRDNTYALPEGLGVPTGAKRRAGRLYLRPYASGLVVVNPSDRPASLSLPADLRAAGGHGDGRLTIGAHDAAILVRGSGSVLRR